MAGPSTLPSAWSLYLCVLGFLLPLCVAQEVWEQSPLVVQAQPGSFFSRHFTPGQYKYFGSQYQFSIESLDAVPKPAWLMFNTSNNNVSGTPPLAQQDQLLRFRVTAADNHGNAESQDVTIQSFVPCQARHFRYFRVQFAAENNAAWYGSDDGLSAICDISWQTGSGSFPSGAGSEMVSSKPAPDALQPPWYDDYRRTPEYAFQHIYGAPYGGDCDGYGSWRGSAGESVTVDLGSRGCQLWPSSIQLQSPYDPSYSIGMPTAFTVDASGSAFEPADDSPQWSRLLAITDFAPVVDPERGVRYPGTYTKSFSIPPAAAPPAAAPGNVSSLAPVTVLAGSGVADTLLDVSAIFQSSSRTGPLQYALIPAGFVPLAGTTRVQSLAPSSPDEYEWIGTSLELLPKFPDNATLLSDKTYEAVQKELINLTASFEAWVDELGITDVPFRQLGTALSSKLQNGALADWLGRGVQGLLNRLGLKGASFQPDIALLKKRLAAPGLADLLRSSLPTLFAELDVSDVTLREVTSYLDTTVQDPGLTGLLDSSLRDWLADKFIRGKFITSTISDFGQKLLKLNALQLLVDNLPAWASRLGISDSTLQRVVTLVEDKLLQSGVSTLLGSQASTWLSEQGFSDVTVDQALLVFSIKVDDGSLESWFYNDLYSYLDSWGLSEITIPQALAALSSELADVNVQHALNNTVLELSDKFDLPDITFQQVLGNLSSTLQDLGLLQKLADKLTGFLDDQGLTDVTLQQAATSLNEDEEDPDTGVKLWLSTNLPTLVDKLALSNTTLQQVANTLFGKLQQSKLLPSVKSRVATWLSDHDLSDVTVLEEINTLLEPDSLELLSAKILKFVEWYGPRQYTISQLVIIQSSQVPVSAVGVHTFQLTACNPASNECSSIPLKVDVVLPSPPPPPPSTPPPRPSAITPSPVPEKASSPVPAKGTSPSPIAVPPKVQPSPTPSPPPVVQVPANTTSTTLEANYNLQGEGLWPFAAAQQAVFIDSIVALNLSGVTSDKVKFISAILIGRRRLLAEEHQRHLLQAQVANNGQSVDVKFQIQAQDVAATSIVASQLYTATTAGTLTQELATRAATALPGSSWSPTLRTITTASITSVPATAPAPAAATPVQLSAQACKKTVGSLCLDNSSLSRGGVIGIIIGGSVFVLLLIAAIIATIVATSRRRRGY